MSRPALLLALGCAIAAPGVAQKALTGQTAVSFFVEAQDLPMQTPEQMAERAKLLGDEQDAVAADAALNGWKGCVQDALVHWAPLGQGPGVLIDGAWGRCADLERDYRTHLSRMTPSGRQVIDNQLARNLTRTLEEGWRNRLTAQALDQALAAKAAPAPPVAPVQARDVPPRVRDERTPPAAERRPGAALPRGVR